MFFNSRFQRIFNSSAHFSFPNPKNGDCKERFCGYINRQKNRRGVPVIRIGAEIRPEEPDPDHAGVGIANLFHTFRISPPDEVRIE